VRVFEYRLRIFLAALMCVSAGIVAAATPLQPSGPENQEAAYEHFLQREATLGPARVTLRGDATLDLPDGVAFLPEKSAREFMKRIGNDTDRGFRGIVLPRKRDTWFVFLEYNASGYIKDDDAKEWDADSMLADIRRNTETSNVERKVRGVPELEILGWVEKPHYDPATHRMIWSISARTKGAKNDADNIINYRTLVLGRQGYTALVMVTDLSAIQAQKPIALLLLSKLHFESGKRYTDFNASTDSVAAYGLAALIGGVVVHKLGFFALLAAFAAKAAKFVGIAAVAAFAAFRRFFRRGKPSSEMPAPPAEQQ
jgi:uncharacterized membrane-anchored protein